MFLFLLGCIAMAGPMARTGHAQGLETKNIRDIYRQLSYTLRDSYTQGDDYAICRHPLHVVLALDTSGSMVVNFRLAKFYRIWDRLLDHFFVQGDRFTLIPFHNQVLTPGTQGAPQPSTRDYPQTKTDLAELKGWFSNPAYQQPIDQKGAYLRLAQLEALRLAHEVKQQDAHRVVLVLVVTDIPYTNADATTPEGRRENELQGQIAEQMKGFRTGGKSSNAETMGYNSFELPDDQTADLLVYHVMEAGFAEKSSKAMNRRVYIKETVPPAASVDDAPPSDPRRMLAPWGGLCLLVAVACLAAFRFKVRVIPSGVHAMGDTEKTLWAYRSLLVSACDSAEVPDEDEVWLALPGSTPKPQPLVSIRGLLPGSCIIRRVGGVLQRPQGGAANEVEIAYGKGDNIQIGLRPNELRSLQVVPEAWLEGKMWPLAGAGFFLLASVVLVSIALSVPQERPRPRPMPPETKPLCASGILLVQSWQAVPVRRSWHNNQEGRIEVQMVSPLYL
jgi:hypothetical protein